MDNDILEFEDYDIKINLKDIESMNKEEVESCLNKIEEIKKMIG